MDGVDAAEIVGIQGVLAARSGGRLLPHMVLKHGHDLVEDMHDRHAELGAGHIDLAAQRLVHQARQHRSRFSLQTIQHPVQLEARPNQAPAVRDDRQMLELDRRRTDDRVERFPGRVRDQMEIEPVRGHLGTITGLTGVREGP
jgi:hypothetical protein